MRLYIGLPIPYGRLLDAADELDLPILLSANAFARPWPRALRHAMPFPGFKSPVPRLARRRKTALDSAGFVALKTYRGFPWSVAQYIDLAAQFENLDIYSQLDCCNEPEVASDRQEVLMRCAYTARLYAECRREAERRGIKPPMPVLQGFRLDDYARCIDMMPILDWPKLVGIGSVCRRPLTGPDGLEAILDGLDRLLDPHVRFHAFGAKTLGALSQHPRLASTDSQAWDMRARYDNPIGRTMDLRVEALRRWLERQQDEFEAAARERPIRLTPPESTVPDNPEKRDAALSKAELEIAELLSSGEIDFQSVHPGTVALWEAIIEEYEIEDE
jgi:hypothetical protein